MFIHVLTFLVSGHIERVIASAGSFRNIEMGKMHLAINIEKPILGPLALREAANGYYLSLFQGK